MLKRLLAVFTATFIALAGIAFAAELRQDHPSTYVVRKGDTLWDISARFLKKPWLWPEIWQANPQVKNPHLIYPGDVLSLVYVGGRPYVSGPQVHTGEPVNTIPLGDIEAFLKELTVVDNATSLPYVIGLEEDRLRSAGGQVVYVRGMSNPQPGQIVQLARPMQEYYRGKNFSFASDLNFRGERWDTGWGQHWAAGTGGVRQNTPKGKRSLLGVELAKMGLGEITQVQGEIAVVVLQGNGTEVREGDRVLPAETAPYDASFMPSAPTSIRADARILSITDALRYSGPRNVIALSVGSEDGVKNGTTFSLWHDGAFRPDNVKYKNAFKAKKDGLAMPDDFLGHAMVFRTFNKVSYALIMDGIRPAQVGDLLKHPDATQ